MSFRHDCLAVGAVSAIRPPSIPLCFPNRFTIQRTRVEADGTITLTLKLPGAGLATAWDDNLASTALVQPAAHRFAFGRLHLTVTHAGCSDPDRDQDCDQV